MKGQISQGYFHGVDAA